jgi:hypothetical protein
MKYISLFIASVALLASVTRDEHEYSYGCLELSYPEAVGQYEEGKGLEGGPDDVGGTWIEVDAD